MRDDDLDEADDDESEGAAVDVDEEEEDPPPVVPARRRGRPVTFSARLRQLDAPRRASGPSWWTQPQSREEFSAAAAKRAGELQHDRDAARVKVKLNFD